MFNKTKNIPESPENVYDTVLAAFTKITLEASGKTTIEKAETFLESKAYVQTEVIELLSTINISPANIERIYKGFEESNLTQDPTYYSFLKFLESESDMNPTADVVEISRDRASALTAGLKHIPGYAIAGAGVISLAACAGVMFNTPSDTNAPVLEPSESTYQLSPEQHAENIKGFIDISEFLSDANNIMVLHTDGTMSIEEVRSLQELMMECNNDLDYTDMTQDVPASCTNAVNKLSSAVNDGKVGAALEVLQSGPQGFNTNLKIKMIQEYQDLKRMYENKLENTPDDNPAEKLRWTLILLTILAGLAFSVAVAKSNSREESRNVGDIWHTLRAKINALASKNTGANDVSPEPKVQSHRDTTPAVKERVTQKYVGSGVDLSPEAKLAAAKRARANPVIEKGGTLQGSDWNGLGSHPKK